MDSGKVGAALVGERSCIVDPLLSFGCRVDEYPNVFQSHGPLLSAVSDMSARREARLGDTDWFNKASAINRLTASRVEASYLSRQDRMTSGSTRAQAAALTRRASCPASLTSRNSPDALAAASILVMWRTRRASWWM